MDIVIIQDRSAGNETVGEMWQETKIFNEQATLKEVIEWAFLDRISKIDGKVYLTNKRKVTITIADEKGY